MRQRDAAIGAYTPGVNRSRGSGENSGPMFFEDPNIFTVLGRLAEMPEVIDHLARDQYGIFVATPFYRNRPARPSDRA